MIHVPPPLTVVDAAPAPSPAMLSINDILTDPPPRSGDWIAAVCRRLLAAYALPVAYGVSGPFADRLDAAGWFCAAEGSDPNRARGECWRGAPEIHGLGIGYGSLRPSLILVSERAPKPGQFPLHGRCGTWTFLALRQLGYDELTCYATNARNWLKHSNHEALTKLYRLTAQHEPRWVALGMVAQRALERIGIDHVPVMHPSKHKRFHHAEGIAGFAARLEAGGLARGPWFGRDLPVHKAPLPELSAPYGFGSPAYVPGRGGGTSHETTNDRLGGTRPGVSQKKAGAARLVYVEGRVPSLREAAKHAGANERHLMDLAREEGWEQQRADHQRRLVDEALAASRAKASRIAARAVGSAWEGVAIGLSKTVTDMQKDGAEVTPGQVKTLLDVALTLEDRTAGGEVGRTGPRGAELAKALQDMIGGAFGVKAESKVDEKGGGNGIQD